MAQDVFAGRHIGPRETDQQKMLAFIGESSVNSLIEKTIPASIRLKKELNIAPAISEFDYLNHIKQIGSKNKVFQSFIGLGYYGTIVPPVIQRNVLENPGWYTAYTPYQAEIAQGRLEALLNFQTMVMDLTGMEIANASLLDEGTAAGEAMIMFYNSRTKEQNTANKFFVSNTCFPQTIDVLKTRSNPLGIELVVGDYQTAQLDNSFFGACLQYPNMNGEVEEYKSFTGKAHEIGVKVAVASDLLSLVLLTPPGEWGADVVFGNSQRFGVPMGYGGPHAAFFATKDEFKRNIPGRIIGVSVDKDGNPALRMALQTREQHIRRDKATSNICTAQALLAVMASMYAVYHGPQGLKQIAGYVHKTTASVARELTSLGYVIENKVYFDTITIKVNVNEKSGIEAELLKKEINVRYNSSESISISFDESTRITHVNSLLEVFAGAKAKSAKTYNESSILSEAGVITGSFSRSSAFCSAEVFNRYHSESEMMRYLKKLENRDLSLCHSMIPLGSCTMKLNAASELMTITWPEFANIHPFAPINQAMGYQQIFDELDKDLSEATGFAKVSLQPNSGAQGEYAGLMVIRAYHESRGEGHRDICLIPSSAHGTNPASAVMAGMKVVVTKCDEQGNIDIADLRQKADLHKDNLSCLMVTYPSTHGVFEEGIIEITDIIHDRGGQVYMDGANMNAQVGLTNPGNIGADVCHLNLHKTFAIPHGGGGPGMGPIGVAVHLAHFLPGNPLVKTGGKKAIPAISSAPWGSSLILLISYGYIKMLGGEGLKKSTEIAILNANYIKKKLEGQFSILYSGKNNTVAHEMIVDCREFKRTANIEVEDIAKRLMDYGYHAPTVSFPVAGTLMIEPTESESMEELDKFCEALLSIREEIRKIEQGVFSKENNLLKNAPHNAECIIDSSWDKEYSRKEAAYPLPYLINNKFWVPVRRVDNAYGDRNLVCSCLPLSSYEETTV
ncbi:MAG: aminomethyl-transferring glycine dehydrogenase [Flavobacteriales bacterium]